MHFDCTTDRGRSMIKTYSEMILLPSFEERFRYLKLFGKVGESVFGYHRYVNQAFYTSRRWRSARSEVILRDDGCDLGIPDRKIFDKVFIHHINPVSLEQLEDDSSELYNPDNLICVSYDTHLAIHYGDESLLRSLPVDRYPNDTKLW